MPGFYRRRDSPYWWYHWRESGRKRFKSTGCKTRAAAYAWLENQGKDEPTTRKKRLTVKFCVEAYVKMRTGQGKLEKSYAALETLWVDALGSRLIHSIEPAEVTEHLERWATDRKWRASSRNTALGQLSGLFAWAVRRGYCDTNPCKQVERLELRNQRSTWLDPEQIAALAQAAPQRWPKWAQTWSDMVVLAAATGLRMGRLLDLKWSDYALDGTGRAYLVVRVDKNGQPTLKLLAGEVRSIIDRRMEAAEGEPDELILPGPWGGNAHSLVRRWLPKACKLAKITHGRDVRGGFVWHDLRRTMASTALSEGVGQRTVQLMGNWKDPRMLDRYMILADEQLQEAEAKVARVVTRRLRSEPDPS